MLLHFAKTEGGAVTPHSSAFLPVTSVAAVSITKFGFFEIYVVNYSIFVLYLVAVLIRVAIFRVNS